ncbi:phosphotransferase family protein [Ligilactobacillus cholophilus]|uniref:phosphotransferase family protein n=1 Tax=Ligilactobacillus cholophilus TaxID=3050131 RepID=UPI0025AF5D1C|nr:phosphotransferase family protein [Ligilactobacillus cholophilus]
MDSNPKKGWRILPVGGNTGMAYMGEKNDRRLFLKRNTSPFLAALSLEEITPRLVWTKRMVSGDTLTAQEWMNGRNLHRNEMKQSQVSDLLARVHHSELLKRMWKQVGGKITTPQTLIDECYINISPDLRSHPLISKVLKALNDNQPQLECSNYEVCHGDLNHKNCLLSDTGKLYLVDWDSAKLADPALDLSMLMCRYVPRDEWQNWLKQYLKAEPSDSLKKRIVWYTFLNLIQAIEESHRRGRFHEMNQDIIKLSEIVKDQSYYEI